MGTIKTDTVTGLADPNKATIPNTITMGSTTATLNFGNTVIANASAGSSTITGEGGSTTTNLQQGLCKAWGKFDGTAGSVAYSDSFNMSGLTDNGTGEFTFTYSNNMSNDDYATMSNCTFFSGLSDDTTTTTSAVQIFTSNSSAAVTDREETCATINGDLA